MKYFLGLDLGTGGIKSVLFDQNGNEVTFALQEYPLYQPHNGWAEQEPEDWYNAAVATIRTVVKQADVPAEAIVGIGIAGQMMGAVLLDSNGEPLRKAILWNDQRTGEATKAMAERVGADRMLKVTCNPPREGLTAAKIFWVEQNEPEVFAQTAHILLPKDYVRYRLTGEFATEVSDASATQLLDTPGRCWSDEMMAALDITPSMLPKVYESYQITGTLRPEAARAVGLSEKVVVVGGAGDNAAASVGTGVVAAGRAMTTIGTSGVVFAFTNRPALDPKGRVYTFCTAVPDAWHMMGLVNSAGLSLKWWRNGFYPDDEEYLKIDEEIARSPIGANHLIYNPYLMGEASPYWDVNARGSFVGLSAIQTREDLTRAVMEGITFALKESMDIYREIGVDPKVMRMCGGGSKAPIWRQMMADIYNIPVALPAGVSENSAALGAAILTMVGTGTYPDVPTACDQIVSLRDEQYLPNPEASAKYEKLAAIYRRVYPALQDIYRDLRNLEL